MTGYDRSGSCKAWSNDPGAHYVCAKVTDEFLEQTKAAGNDLSTPRGGFPGLRDGDSWCLCGKRWKQSLQAGTAPPIVLEATHKNMLDFVPLETLEQYKAEAM